MTDLKLFIICVQIHISVLANQKELALNPSKWYSPLPQNIYILFILLLLQLP